MPSEVPNRYVNGGCFCLQRSECCGATEWESSCGTPGVDSWWRSPWFQFPDAFFPRRLQVVLTVQALTWIVAHRPLDYDSKMCRGFHGVRLRQPLQLRFPFSRRFADPAAYNTLGEVIFIAASIWAHVRILMGIRIRSGDGAILNPDEGPTHWLHNNVLTERVALELWTRHAFVCCLSKARRYGSASVFSRLNAMASNCTPGRVPGSIEMLSITLVSLYVFHLRCLLFHAFEGWDKVSPDTNFPHDCHWSSILGSFSSLLHYISSVFSRDLISRNAQLLCMFVSLSCAWRISLVSQFPALQNATCKAMLTLWRAARECRWVKSVTGFLRLFWFGD